MRFLRALVVAAHVNRRTFEFHHVGEAHLTFGFLVRNDAVVEVQFLGIDLERLRCEGKKLFARLDARFVRSVAIYPRCPAAADPAVARHDGAVGLLELDLICRHLQFLADDFDDDREHTGALVDYRRDHFHTAVFFDRDKHVAFAAAWAPLRK